MCQRKVTPVNSLIHTRLELLKREFARKTRVAKEIETFKN